MSGRDIAAPSRAGVGVAGAEVLGADDSGELPREEGRAQRFEHEPLVLGARAACAVLAPSILGLALSRVGRIVLSYGGYRSSDLGLTTDGATLIAIIILVVPMVMLARPGRYVGRHVAWRICLASVVLQSAMLLAVAGAGVAGFDFGAPGRMAISAVSEFCFAGSTFFWLRHARGTDGKVAALFVMLAMAVSEVLICALAFLPTVVSQVIAGALCLGQLPCVRASRSRAPIFSIRIAGSDNQFFDSSLRSPGAARGTSKLITMAIGITIMGFAVGILRGFPLGGVIEFHPQTRLLYSAITIGVCCLMCLAVRRGHADAMTTGIWAVMLNLGAAALVLSAAFPGHLDVGLACTNALNALMIALCWYTCIAFSGAGAYDAYFYCIFIMSSYLAPRALTRTLLLTVPVSATMLNMAFAVTGFLLLLCAECVFICFMYGGLPGFERAARVARGRGAGSVALEGAASASAVASAPAGMSAGAGDVWGARGAGDADGASRRTPRSPLSRMLGISEDITPVELSELSLRQLVGELARTFKLSGSEEEVMLLYVQGATQARIAEQLGISANTAHAHIKHIYAKCNLHSRQELLDLMYSLEKY